MNKLTIDDLFKEIEKAKELGNPIDAAERKLYELIFTRIQGRFATANVARLSKEDFTDITEHLRTMVLGHINLDEFKQPLFWALVGSSGFHAYRFEQNGCLYFEEGHGPMGRDSASLIIWNANGHILTLQFNPDYIKN